MFETLKMRAMNVATQAILSLCASRRTPGIMMDLLLWSRTSLHQWSYADPAPVVEHVTPDPSAADAAPVTTTTVVTQPVSTASFASETVLPHRELPSCSGQLLSFEWSC